MFHKIITLAIALLPLTTFANATCGQDGSIDERIADCSHYEASASSNYVLVTRDQDLKEVRKDLSTGLLWSDRLSPKMNYADAAKTCESFSESGKQNWRLPTIQEFQRSTDIVRALVNIKDFYWSSTNINGGTDMKMIFSGHDPRGQIAMRLEYNGIAVRCVTE